MEKETRAGKYGRFLATSINFTIKRIPKNKREEYKKKFLEELKTYSFEPRKKGSPRNSGCVHELSDLTDVDIKNPLEYARTIKEGLHFAYNKETSRRIYESLIKYLSS